MPTPLSHYQSHLVAAQRSGFTGFARAIMALCAREHGDAQRLTLARRAGDTPTPEVALGQNARAPLSPATR